LDSYDFRSLQDKWSPIWQRMDLYAAGDDPDRPYFYCLDYFPYPSGAGLSVGHCRNYIPTDVISRKKRMDGVNVLHPMGWDAFGQPAEEYAIKTGIHPAEVTRMNTDTYRRQMKLFEAGYDWTREIDSSRPDYYRWTQFFFLLLFDRGLAYQSDAFQMYCPACRIVLSNEEAAGGVCWRCGGGVARKRFPQWYFRITEYAQRLLDDLNDLDWPEGIKAMQRNWIGRSEGAEVVFPVLAPGGATLEMPVYTTRIDTIYGATFCVMAPEHPDLLRVTEPCRRAEVEDYLREVSKRSDTDRQSDTGRDKTGVFTGSFALNPFTGERIPLWVADYVLGGYGTAAIMAVPGHDQRDHDFARKFGLPILEVIAPGGIPRGVEEAAAEADGLLVNSGPFSGLPSDEARRVMAEYAGERGFGGPEVRFRIRDWLVSRQRYWGAPIPMIHCPDCGAVPDRNLPVLLPDVESFEPDDSGLSPLARATDWVKTPCPVCGRMGTRETSTMAGFACSSWYFLRFASPRESGRPFDPEAVKKWLPVDMYVGGAEHAVMHLIYARFFTKVMYDSGMVDFQEPFATLKNQGMLLSYDHQKMSKSKGNVITPDEVVARYGADALRLYILFMGPFEAELEWSEEGISGTYRFVRRVWKLFLSDREPAPRDESLGREIRRRLAKTVKKVTDDVDTFQFNTAVAALMEFINFLAARRDRAGAALEEWNAARKDFLVLLAPMAPFIAEEIWQRLGLPGETVHRAPWPSARPEDLHQDTVEMAIQFTGRVRCRMTVPSDAGEGEITEMALSHPRVVELLQGREPRRVVVVPGSLVNIIP
jgi:leucyl-tRNA synthetase